MSQGLMQPGATPEPVDPNVIDAQFQQLEAEAQQLGAAIDGFGHKLQAAALNGDSGAKVWISELRLIAMQVRAEQEQMHTLLQAMHAFTAHALHQLDLAQAAAAGAGQGGTAGSPPPAQPQYAPPLQAQATYPQQPPPQSQPEPQAAPSTIPGSTFPGQPQPQGPYAQPPQPQAPYAQGSQMAYEAPGDMSVYEAPQQQSAHHSMFAGLGAAGGGALAGVAGMFGMRRLMSGRSSGMHGMGRSGPSQGTVYGDSLDQSVYGGGYASGRGGGMVQGGNASRFLSGRMGSMLKMGAMWGIDSEVMRHM